MVKRVLRFFRLLGPSFEEKISPMVAQQATDVIHSHNRHNNEKALFIDMGSNLGQGFSFFSQHYEPDIFDYWLIEANPYCINKLKSVVSRLYKRHLWSGSWKVQNVAISNKEGELDLYGLVEDRRGKTSTGASVVKEHNSRFYDSDGEKALRVKSVKVSNLIEEASKSYSTIVVKMDIEAAEYDALEDLIETGFINKINRIYVEWHSQYFAADKAADVRDREKKIKCLLADKLTDWH